MSNTDSTLHDKIKPIRARVDVMPAGVYTVHEHEQFNNARNIIIDSETTSAGHAIAEVYHFPHKIDGVAAFYANAPADVRQLLEVVDGLADMLRPFADLHAAYLEYRTERLDAGLRRRQLLDFIEWIERYGVYPDTLLELCRTAAAALGVKGEAE